MVTGILETLEERLTTLEQEMAQVKERLASQNDPQTNPWLNHVYGAFKDDPLFEEAVKYGQEWRASQNRMDDEEDDVPDGHG